MRILFVSNLYPPAHLGGMELRMQETVGGLVERGHNCLVLTSDYTPDGINFSDPENVLRLLPLETKINKYDPFEHLLKYPGRLHAGWKVLRQQIDNFDPDLIFFWGMWNFSPSFIEVAQTHGSVTVVNSFAGYWPIEPDTHQQYWCGGEDQWFGGFFKDCLRPIALSGRYRPVKWAELDFQHAIFCSGYVKQQLTQGGVTFQHARVVLSGIDTNMFRPDDSDRSANQSRLRLLLPGAIVPHKGAHTVIDALRRLKEKDVSDIHLTIVGNGQEKYIMSLNQMIGQSKLESAIDIIPAISREQMPQMMRDADVVVLATISEEPLSRVVMEGMASAVVVIASDTGGTSEMIRDGEDGLLFPAGDSKALAFLLAKVYGDFELRTKMGDKARQTAVERFDLQRMIDEIEDFLFDSLLKE